MSSHVKTKSLFPFRIKSAFLVALLREILHFSKVFLRAFALLTTSCNISQAVTNFVGNHQFQVSDDEDEDRPGKGGGGGG